MGRTACTEPQCLYKGAPLPLPIPLLPLWAVRPVQSLSAFTRVHFTISYCLSCTLDSNLFQILSTHTMYHPETTVTSLSFMHDAISCVPFHIPINQTHGFWQILLQVIGHIHKTAEAGKAVPLQARSGPEGSRKLRFPDYVTTAQDGGKVVSLTHRPLFTPRK